MPLARSRSRRKGKANEESPAPESSPEKAATPAQAQQMPAYAMGRGTITGVPLLDGAPVQAMPLEDEQSGPLGEELIEEQEQAAQEPEEEKVAAEQEEVSNQSLTPVSDVSGEGEKSQETAYSVTLRGRTDASFSSSFSTEDVVTTRGTGCNGCAAGDCVHARGTLVSTYTVSTTVTLPSVNDFPNLRPCQRQRVQDGITNVLAPHEQQHVSAFNTYDGTTRRPFDMTICRGAFDAAIRRMFNAEDTARRAAARALSNALDPFQFDVDLNCEEPDAGPPGSDAGPPAPRASTPGDEEVEA